MANIGVELKRLLTKLGGTPSKYDQTNELLHKITDQVNAGGSGGGGLVVETEWDEEVVAPASPRFKSSIKGTDLRAAITSGQNVVVHIPGKVDYGIGELYFPLMLELKDRYGQDNVVYRLFYDKSGNMPWSSIMDGNDDDDGYVQFEVHVD